MLERYTELTGRIGMPPLWALGNQQSRWSYESADEVREIAREFRERGIPCDVIHFDIDHMDGYRVFTWDPERFPDPRGLIEELRADGFRVVCITDPGVKVDEGYELYTSGRDRGLFCRDGPRRGVPQRRLARAVRVPRLHRPGRARVVGRPPGLAARRWASSGVWCDMDEPALFVPDRADDARRRRAPGRRRARLPRRGPQRLRLARWPAPPTRACAARGRTSGRSSSPAPATPGCSATRMQWTGDNSSWWEHLWMSMPQLQNLGLSGVAFCGVDVGGFFGDCHGELLARWTEFGVFQPFCRNHACKGTARQEPWAFGEPWESVCRDMIRLRMRLLPYLYGLFDEAARTGAPVLRPLLFEHPDDPTTYTADDEFLLGDALLVAPITPPGHRAPPRLPARGHVVRTGSPASAIEGPAHVLAHAPLGHARPSTRRANAADPAVAGAARPPPAARPDELTLRVFAAPGAGAVERESLRGRGRRLRRRGAAHRVVRRLDAAAVGARGLLRAAARAPARRALRRRRRTSCRVAGAAAEVAIGLPSTDGS